MSGESFSGAVTRYFIRSPLTPLMLGTIVLYLARRPDTVAQSLEEMLRW